MSTPPVSSSTSYPATLPDLPQDGADGDATESMHAGGGDDGGGDGPAWRIGDQRGDFFVGNDRLRGYTETGSNATAHGHASGQHGAENGNRPSHAGPSPEQPRPGRPGTVPGEQNGHAPARGDVNHQGSAASNGRVDGRPTMPPQGANPPGQGNNPPGQGTWPGNGNGNGFGHGNGNGFGHGNGNANGFGNGNGNGFGNGQGNGQAHGLGLGLGLGNVLHQIGGVAGHLLQGLSGTGNAAAGILSPPGPSTGANAPPATGLPAPVSTAPSTVGDVLRTATSTLPATTMPAQQGAAHAQTTASGNGGAAKGMGLTPAHDGAASSKSGGTSTAGNSSTMQAATMPSGAGIARAIPTAAPETAHPNTLGMQRGPAADPVQIPTGARSVHAIENPAALGMQSNPSAAGARGAAAPASTLSPIQAGTLTLAFAPQLQVGSEDGSTGQTALFRGQGAEGPEGLRDILGRSYVFSADGKLITRAEERREVDPLNPIGNNEEVNELSASNHGELSTHDLVWKVVVPAFVGVGTLLGGASLGAAGAAGSSGMGGAFLLVAAAGIFGYGSVRAAASLREMHDAGERIGLLDNPVARRHWIAAGSQSLGSLASLALLLV